MVTGATGFLGAHIVRSLLKPGMNVHVISTKRPGSSPWRLKEVQDQINVVDMDMLNDSSIHQAVSTQKPSAVIHCAAYGVDYKKQDSRLAVSTNIVGSYELFEASVKNKVSRFVHIGSCFEYGDKNYPIRENESLDPTAIYGATKAAASLLLLKSEKALQVDLTILRPFGIWGPFEGPNRLVPQIIQSCLDNKPLDLTSCEQVRDYTYAPDMAELIATIAVHKNFPGNSVMNLGSGEPVVLRNFFLAIAKELGGESLMRFGKLPYRPSEMPHLVADISKQRSLISKFKTTPFFKGIRTMLSQIDSYKNYYS